MTSNRLLMDEELAMIRENHEAGYSPYESHIVGQLLDHIATLTALLAETRAEYVLANVDASLETKVRLMQEAHAEYSALTARLQAAETKLGLEQDERMAAEQLLGHAEAEVGQQSKANIELHHRLEDAEALLDRCEHNLRSGAWLLALDDLKARKGARNG